MRSQCGSRRPRVVHMPQRLGHFWDSPEAEVKAGRRGGSRWCAEQPGAQKRADRTERVGRGPHRSSGHTEWRAVGPVSTVSLDGRRTCCVYNRSAESREESRRCFSRDHQVTTLERLQRSKTAQLSKRCNFSYRRRVQCILARGDSMRKFARRRGRPIAKAEAASESLQLVG